MSVRRAATLLVLACLTVAAGGLCSRATAEANPRQVRVDAPAPSSEGIVVGLEIDDLTGVVAIDLDVRFDSRLFSVVDVRPTALLSGFMAVDHAVADTLRIAVASATAAAGTGRFLEILLQGQGVPQLQIARMTLNGGLIPVEVIGAAVDITAIALAEAALLPHRLWQNAPNPFNATTVIPFSLAVPSAVTLVVFDLLGRPVCRLVDQELEAGAHQARWDGTNAAGVPVASGVYWYRLQVQERGVEHARPMVLAR